MQCKIVQATEADVKTILEFVRDLARYEKLEHEVVADEETLRRTLFGDRRFAEVIFLEENGVKVGFALFFHNYSTFLGKPGLYLEDLYVKPEHRGKGYGKRLLSYLANLAVQRDCGRLEWWVLDWNIPALEFYRSIGAEPMAEWTVQRMSGDVLSQFAKSFKEQSSEG